MTLTVAYLGPAGTFTEAALWRFTEFGPLAGTPIDPLPVDSPAAALDAVRSGEAAYACVAIENSVDGPVTATFDALAAAPGVQIYAEVDLDIAFAIMVRPGTNPADVRTFSTHPVAKQQVASWLESTWPQVEYIPASSNGAAAQAVADGTVDAAAAPARAAELHGLDIVADGVADVQGAHTRFVLVGPAGHTPERTGDDRTAVVFTLPKEPGTLVGALTEFSLRRVDLSRIESRPTRTELGTYRFHVDIVGHINDAPLAEALAALYLRCDDLTFLGSWPRQGPKTGEKYAASDERLARGRAWVSQIQQGGHGQ